MEYKHSTLDSNFPHLYYIYLSYYELKAFLRRQLLSFALNLHSF